MKKKETKNNRELCVVCGKDAGYTKETPISQRKNYIEGAGQLCQKCYTEIYVKK